MNARTLCLLVVAVAMVVLAGCQRRFTHERFEMIQVGVDDREDVRLILGKPNCDLDNQWLYDDLNRHCSAVIHFDENGRVRGKEWMDARAGLWEGRHPDADQPPAGEVREHRKKTIRIDED